MQKKTIKGVVKAGKHFRELHVDHRKRLKTKIEEIRKMNLHEKTPSEIGELLHSFQESWNLDNCGNFSFTDFEFLLIDQLSLGWGRSRIIDFKMFWRIYHTKSKDSLRQFEANQIEALKRNCKRRTTSLMRYPLDRKDFYLDPERKFEQLLKGQITPDQIRIDIKNCKLGRPQQYDTADFADEKDIENYIWENRERLRPHGINLECKQVTLPDCGPVEFIGYQKNRLIIVEVKNAAESPDVGQTIVYVNEVKEIVRRKAWDGIKSQQGDASKILKQQSWEDIQGYIVAQNFQASFYHAVKDQDLSVYRAFKGNNILSDPFVPRSSNKNDWDEFTKERLP